jgi:hypothetical protein
LEQSERLRLLHGPYKPPKVRPGQWTRCLVRGAVRCCGTSSALIPWPWARTERANRPTPIVNRDLARAIRHEAEVALVHHFGVSIYTVWKWRKALGVPSTTDGTRRLRLAIAQMPDVKAGRVKGQAKNQDLERCRKISAAMQGIPKPPSVVEAIGRIWRGKKMSAEHRAKMSAAHKARGTRPPKAGRPWTKAEDALLARLPAGEVAKRTGRTLQAVYARRYDLGLPDGRRR